MQESNYDFGESEIAGENITENELKSHLSSSSFGEGSSKAEAPLSFTLSTNDAKIKIQLYEDIGENKINALINGINNVTENILGDAASAAAISFEENNIKNMVYGKIKHTQNPGSFIIPEPDDDEEFLARSMNASDNEMLKKANMERLAFIEKAQNSSVGGIPRLLDFMREPPKFYLDPHGN